MPKKHFTPEQIIPLLRQTEVETANGKKLAEVCRAAGITEQTYYRWRRQYGGMRVDEAKRMKELEKENIRLRKAISDLTLDNQMLKEVAKGKF
jgi:transposase-like protein